ncbi:Eukaryotic translation initiation factor 3 subunit D [Coelomomyces lativittatus]|nr:Eukaryotic translation initiation factor 3 subunit D [Coelomomyces lativittatus]KAJ1505404.1 Eukaryotic translation initiation factor 3 subunit D [Coelomomyces lativittatus]
MPYTPYTKQDKLGRVADWIGEELSKDSTYNRQRQPYNKYRDQNDDKGSNKQPEGADTSNQAFGYQHTQDETSFSLVDGMGKFSSSSSSTSSGFFQNKSKTGHGSWARTMSASLLSTHPRRYGNTSSSSSQQQPQQQQNHHHPQQQQQHHAQPHTASTSNPMHPRSTSTTSSLLGDRRSSTATTHPKRFPSQPSTTTSNAGRMGSGGRSHMSAFVPYHTNPREASISVKDDWVVIHEFDLHKMGKVSADVVPVMQKLQSYGALGQYIKSFDKVNCKNEVPLKELDPSIISSLSSLSMPVISDPFFKRHEEQHSKISDPSSSPKMTVYTTDVILSMLMVCPKSMHSWDLVITRVGDHSVYIDRRPNTTPLETMHENAPNDVYAEHDRELNSPGNLAAEATYINQAFKHQVVDMTIMKPLEANDSKPTSSITKSKSSSKKKGNKASTSSSTAQPTLKDEPGIVYRSWDLGMCTIVARTQVDAFLTQASKEETTLIRALTHVPGLLATMDWRRQLDTQRGTVTATEIRYNTFKMARWAIQGLLADADWIRIGFVSRVSSKDPDRHTILGSSIYRISMLASQMNIAIPNAWGVLSQILELVVRQPEGQYVLFKDPSQAAVRLYALPSTRGIEDLNDAENELVTSEEVSSVLPESSQDAQIN